MVSKKGFDSEPVHNEKYLKTKIKSYEEKISTNFRKDKISKEGTQCICLSVILIDSVLGTDKNYHPQVLLEECKCGINISFDDSDREDSDYSDEENSNEESNFE